MGGNFVKSPYVRDYYVQKKNWWFRPLRLLLLAAASVEQNQILQFKMDSNMQKSFTIGVIWVSEGRKGAVANAFYEYEKLK